MTNISEVGQDGMKLSELISIMMEKNRPQHCDVECEWCAHPFEVTVTYSSFILLMSYFKVKL